MKYKLTNKTIKVRGATLHQIQALKDFADVKAGDLGGWIEREENLSQESDCWVYDAKVFSYRKINGNIKVSCNADLNKLFLVMTSDEFIRTKYAIPKEYQYELTTEQWLESMEEYAAFKNDKGFAMPNITLVQ